MSAFHNIIRVGDSPGSMIDRRIQCHTVKYNYYRNSSDGAAAVKDIVIQRAPAFGAAVRMIAQKDVATMLAIRRNAQELIPEGAGIFHHGNTGALAAAEYGTALGITRGADKVGIPFCLGLPKSTLDMDTPSGDWIEMEERAPEEVTHFGEYQITPDGTPVGNPAFDVTPARYITAFITEDRIVYPPYQENLAKLFED